MSHSLADAEKFEHRKSVFGWNKGKMSKLESIQSNPALSESVLDDRWPASFVLRQDSSVLPSLDVKLAPWKEGQDREYRNRQQWYKGTETRWRREKRGKHGQLKENNAAEKEVMKDSRRRIRRRKM